ncbi:unnamed protein product [Soboliphyme baturini]|uniref:Importin N-terminal domain-containing protein n=1 Tax=Soboliphyme baturini TaxID=241478 RepID=A0A183IDZ0_9BILA|nr:unnamed protein product [Soboliphyme baturini]
MDGEKNITSYCRQRLDTVIWTPTMTTLKEFAGRSCGTPFAEQILNVIEVLALSCGVYVLFVDVTVGSSNLCCCSVITLVYLRHTVFCLDPNDHLRAVEFLKQACDSNFAEFVKQLSEILCDANEQAYVRQAAGLQLKNSLTAKDTPLKMEHMKRWLALDTKLRDLIKTNSMSALGTETTKPSIAAQCVASIACAELPHGYWRECVTQLMQNVTHPSSTETLKGASLEALGYICQDVVGIDFINSLNDQRIFVIASPLLQDPSVFGSGADEILTAIVYGMRKEETSSYIRLVATQALLNSLEFTTTNFEKENERNVIMQVVCEATQAEYTEVRVAALQCLVRIMSLYYQYMEHYMSKALFAITLEAMKSPIENIALQGIEFWSNVCDEEIELSFEASEAAEHGKPPMHVSKYYAKGALPHIVPVLTATLAKQDENEDEDEWVPSKAASVCLMLMAQCVGDDVVASTLPFINENIKHPDWHNVDAAIMAFGSVLEGPDPENLKPLVEQAMPVLTQLLSDSHSAVRDSAAWCVGRVCEICQGVVLAPFILNPLLPALTHCLTQEPKVASNACWAITNLTAAAYECAMPGNVSADGRTSGHSTTYILSSCFEAIVNELLKTTDRPDANLSNLRSASYESLMELIKTSPQDCYHVVQNTTIIFLKKLNSILALEGNMQGSSDRSQLQDLQALLCAVLQSCIRRMQREDALNIADTIMQSLLQIMHRSTGKGSGSVKEDALLAISALIEGTLVQFCLLLLLGQDFLKYVEAFKPYLYQSLRNHAEGQVCQVAVGLVDDLCRSLDMKILPFLSETMQILFEILADMSMDKSVKPQILTVFGDIALAIGPNFSPFLPAVLPTLLQAMTAEIDPNDLDQVDFLNRLRESCLEAFVPLIVTVCAVAGEFALIQQHMFPLLQFVEKIISDEQASEELNTACAGLIGDLAGLFGSAILPAVERQQVTDFLSKLRHSKDSRARSLATWTLKEIKKLKQGVQEA